MIRRAPWSTQRRSSAASGVYKRQALVVLFLREIPLRTTQHSDTEALTLAFETGVDPDAEFTDDTTPGVDGSPKGQPSGDRAALGRPEIPGGGLSLIHISEPTRTY